VSCGQAVRRPGSAVAPSASWRSESLGPTASPGVDSLLLAAFTAVILQSSDQSVEISAAGRGVTSYLHRAKRFGLNQRNRG
jgi:hypothetical protein